VRLIHFTLQEYLSTSPDIFSRPPSTMAEICLTYLNSKEVMAIPADGSPDISDTPFIKYSSLHWGSHTKKQLSDHGRSLVLQLLQECDGHISTKLLLEQAGHLELKGVGMRFPVSGLHCASFFGVVEVVATLIETRSYDTDAGDFGGYTPLGWAAENGHEEVVKILLKLGEVNPNKPNDHGRTPLSLAASVDTRRP